MRVLRNLHANQKVPPFRMQQQISNLTEEKIVEVTGFVHNQRIGKKVSFLTLRQGLNTVQCVYNKKDLNDVKVSNDSADSLKYKNEDLISEKMESLQVNESDGLLRQNGVVEMSDLSTNNHLKTESQIRVQENGSNQIVSFSGENQPIDESRTFVDQTCDKHIEDTHLNECSSEPHKNTINQIISYSGENQPTNESKVNDQQSEVEQITNALGTNKKTDPQQGVSLTAETNLQAFTKKLTGKEKRAAKKAQKQKPIASKEQTDNPYTFYTKVPPESFIRVHGRVLLSPVPIKSCTIQNLEIHVTKIDVLSISNDLPFSFKDANASSIERESLGLSSVKQDHLLDYKFLDLRLFHTNSLFRVVSGFMHYIKDFLHNKNFIEIKTPKLIQNSSEGGANLFEVNFFKKKAYLAQSPQLYKQMAVIGGLQRVFEIGHVYRAEESNQNRYLSEFVGIDLEFEITDYLEIIDLVYTMLTTVFTKIKEHYKTEIEIYKKSYPFEDLVYPKKPVLLTFKQCRDFLRSEKLSVNQDLDDFNREEEKSLGRIVKRDFQTDLFVIVDYPTKTRAFYTKFKNHTFSYSFDFIMRGEEILSGARRIDNYNELLHSIESHRISKESLKGYLDAFIYGVPIHGGCGIGFERVLKTFFDAKDIRLFTMFPRDPTRLYP